MSPKKAFGIIAGIFGLAVGLGVIGGITTDPQLLVSAARTPRAASAPVDRAHEHRTQAAEQMIERFTKKLASVSNRCDQAGSPGIAEKCKAMVESTYAFMNVIRETASSGDPARWAMMVDNFHDMEANTETLLNNLSR